jgi:hypothetical protein
VSVIPSVGTGEGLGFDLPEFAGLMTCIPSSFDREKISVAGRVFSKWAFREWAIRSIDDLANQYSNDGAILSTIGPHDFMQDAVASVSHAHKRAFGVVLSRSSIGNSKCGPKHEVACQVPGCPFRLNYELCTVGAGHGWYLVKRNDVHSDHVMSTTPAQKLSSSSTQREIPKDVLVDAKLLYSTAHLDVAQIHKFYVAKFKESSREVTWTAKDLANAFAEDPATRLFDSSDFLKELERRQQERGLRYSHTVDSDGRLSLVFAEVDGGYEAYKQMGDKVVLFYDTTFGTNRYYIYYHREGYCILHLFKFT